MCLYLVTLFWFRHIKDKLTREKVQLEKHSKYKNLCLGKLTLNVAFFEKYSEHAATIL